MPKMMAYNGKFGRTHMMTPKSARRVIAKYVPKARDNFNKRVQKVVDRNLKNTPTISYKFDEVVCSQVGVAPAGPNGPKNWFAWTPGQATFVRNPMTGSSYPMEGDSLKIKKWFIKGQICPLNDSIFSTAHILPQSLLGYVDVYLAKYVNGSQGITQDLNYFYMDGQVPTTPVGKQDELLLPINFNQYKVYAHRRVKVGQSTVQGASTYPANNDFGLCKTFSFDVTQYVCKNRTIRFSGTDTTSQDPFLRSLSLIAVFHPAVGDLGQASFFDSTFLTYYQISAVSFGEYETA